jgi:hypothetical protein
MGWFRKKHNSATGAMASKTFWLSFADEGTGRNLGVCVVDVSADIAAQSLETAKQTNRDPAGAWIVADIGLSVFYNCNPGGTVQAIEVDPARLPGIPRNRLIQEDELQRNGWA